MSVTGEIERLQTAKETLKIKLNTKNDSEHQITDELISEYGDFVDNISTGVDINEYYDLTKRTNDGLRSYIKQIPIIDTSAYTNMANFFESCKSLLELPLIETNKVTNMQNMFNDCKSLKTIPLIDTGNVTNMQNMFLNCTSLITIPQLNTNKVTNMYGMFNGCSSLKTIPSIVTNNVTNMTSMFLNCYALVEIPQFNTSNVISMNSMFYTCSSLTTVPLLNADKVTDLSNVFNYTKKLTNFGGLLNIGQAYSTSSSENYSKYVYKLSSCKQLTHESLINIINGLYDIKTKGCNSQSLTLGDENIAKLTAEEIAIATEKGWTVS